MTLALLKVNSIRNYLTMIRPELGILGKYTAVGMFPSVRPTGSSMAIGLSRNWPHDLAHLPQVSSL